MVVHLFLGIVADISFFLWVKKNKVFNQVLTREANFHLQFLQKTVKQSTLQNKHANAIKQADAALFWH